MVGTKAFKMIMAVLFVSLGLNVYLGAVEAGCWWRGSDRHSAAVGQWKKREEMLREKMSPEDFAVVEAQRKESKPKFKESRKALEAARANVDRAMRAEPFDPAALEAALEAEKQLKFDMLSRMQARRAALSDQLSPEGREIFKSVMHNKEFYRKIEGRYEAQGNKPPSP